MDDPTATVHRVLDLLQRHIDAGGRGAVARLERRLGTAKGYFRKWVVRRSFDFPTLLRALAVLEVDPRGFFWEVLSRDEADLATEGSLDDRTFKAECAGRRVRARPKFRAAKVTAVPAWIEELDELRYHDAELAIRELWARIDEVAGAAEAHYLGVLGSAYRSIGNLREAVDCLDMAESKALDDLGYGDALQRHAYLAAHQGNLDEALSLSEQAAGVFARAGEWVRFGETHVDQAQFFLHRDDGHQASQCLTVAELHVRIESTASPRIRRSLFSMEQCLAGACMLTGDQKFALCHAEKALELAPNPKLKGAGWALTGHICKRAGRYREAVAAFGREIDLVVESPLDTLLATIEMADCLARCQLHRKAVEAAETVARYLAGIDSSSPARAAVTCLWLQARAGELSGAVIETARDAVLQAKAALPRGAMTDRLRRVRRLAEISRSELARATGVPEETLRRIETGQIPGSKHRCVLETWMQLARPELTLQ